jgi:hypothetical protein
MLLMPVLVGLLLYYWDKVPNRVKTALQDAKTMSGEVIEKGEYMPDSVKKFVDNKLIPEVKKFLE